MECVTEACFRKGRRGERRDCEGVRRVQLGGVVREEKGQGNNKEGQEGEEEKGRERTWWAKGGD